LLTKVSATLSVMRKKYPPPEIEDVSEPFCGIRRKNTVPLADYDPELAAEWHFKKNSGFGPEDFSHASNVRVWWMCPDCKRNYKARIVHRSINRSACSYCASKRTCEDNALAVHFPEIAKEWHKKKNGQLRAEDVTYASHLSVWWICRRKHEWRAPIARRTGRRFGCPYCSGIRVTKDNNLKVLYPKISSQWHPNLNVNLKPQHVKPGSHRRVWWICRKGPDHIWQAVVKDRSLSGAGCPACAGKKASVTNSLASLFPTIASEWDKRKNGKLRPSDVLSKSDKEVWWECKRGHSWYQRIASRTARQTSCPKCRVGG
jgi:positive regulator of sigma E activity